MADAKISDATISYDPEDVERVWDLAEKISICMLATQEGPNTIRSRPMSAYPRKAENMIYFLTDARHHKDDVIGLYPHVCLAFADKSGSKYVSLTGRARTVDDRAKIKELWNPIAKAWWDSEDDPNIRVLQVTPEDAEFWDGPGRMVSTFSMLAAAMTDSKPKVGDNKKVEM
jgi:general stress protein 26